MSRFTDLFQEVQEVQEVQVIQPEPTLEKKSKPKSEPEPELIVPENVIIENPKPTTPPQQPKTFAID